jgi:hypothetical protein
MNVEKFIKESKLVPQSYGIQMSESVFGGPRGIWLECTQCPCSERIEGTEDKAVADKLTDENVAYIFRKHGWTGKTNKLFEAMCPRCSDNEK